MKKVTSSDQKKAKEREKIHTQTSITATTTPTKSNFQISNELQFPCVSAVCDLHWNH